VTWHMWYVRSHMWTSQAHMSEPCRMTCSHMILMQHTHSQAHMSEPCRMTCSHMWRCIWSWCNVTWLIHMCSGHICEHVKTWSHMWTCDIHEQVKHMWMSHVTLHIYISGHICEQVKHIWMSHVTLHIYIYTYVYMYVYLERWCKSSTIRTYRWVSSHMYERAMSHIWMSHVAHINASCRTYRWVMSHIWMSHVTHEN